MRTLRRVMQSRETRFAYLLLAVPRETPRQRTTVSVRRFASQLLRFLVNSDRRVSIERLVFAKFQLIFYRNYRKAFYVQRNYYAECFKATLKTKTPRRDNLREYRSKIKRVADRCSCRRRTRVNPESLKNEKLQRTTCD